MRSVMLGDFVARPQAVERLLEPVDALVVATKAAGLDDALERVDVEPAVTGHAVEGRIGKGRTDFQCLHALTGVV